MQERNFDNANKLLKKQIYNHVVCTLVPVVPPPSVVWYNLSSTSLNTTWEPVPAHLCNGIVVGYNVFFWKHSEPQNVSNVTVSEEVALLEDLEKWTIYCGQVEAFTKIGVGPRSQVECIRTFEDGNCYLVKCILALCPFFPPFSCQFSACFFAIGCFVVLSFLAPYKYFVNIISLHELLEYN